MIKRKRIIASILTLGILLPNINVKASQDNYYTKIKEVDTRQYLREMDLSQEREDVRISREGNKDFSRLQLKTSSNYEIATAYSNGAYEYIDKADTYEEAINKFTNLEKGYDPVANTQPVILDKTGQVIYAERAVGRVRKYINGSIMQGEGEISNIYNSKNLTSANIYSYAHHDYISEVPLIKTEGNSANVLIGGYEGWMSYRNAYNDQDSDVVIWPLNQVSYPSYYEVINGVLVHYISLALDRDNSGVKLNLGTAPSYLEEGKKYISYDGMYFYDGDTLQEGIWNETLDLREGSKERSINKDNPHYSYFLNLPFRSKTNYSAEDIDNFINKKIESDPKYKNSKLKDLGKTFKEGEELYGVNALLALGVSINETNYGISNLAQNKNNLFGLNAIDKSPGLSADEFKTPEDSVMDFMKNWISLGFINPRDDRNNGSHLGNKNLGLNVKYASDPFWGEKAASFAFDFDYISKNKNLENLTDEDYYQLIKYTGDNKIIGDDKVWFYDITKDNQFTSSTYNTIAVQALPKKVKIDDKDYVPIYAERNFSMNSGDFKGDYNWNYLGYAEDKNIEYINKGKTGFIDRDFNYDGNIDMIDFAIIGELYNSKRNSANWNERCDLNFDGIIDIYDIVKIASRI